MTRKRNTESEIVVSSSGPSAVPARRKASSRARAKYVASPAEAPAVAEPQVTTPQAVDGPTTTSDPTHQEIALVAYLYWEARGCQGGSAEEDWLRAEHELRNRPQAVTA
jgi:hypothetical protein